MMLLVLHVMWLFMFLVSTVAVKRASGLFVSNVLTGKAVKPTAVKTG